MNVYLVSLSRNGNQIQLSLAFAVLTNALRQHNIEPHLIDLIPIDVADRKQFFASQIPRERAIFAFSVTIGNGHINITEEYAQLVLSVNPQHIILYGGPLASSSPDILLHNCLCKYILTGEGEYTLPALVTALRQGVEYPDPREIRGLHYKRDGVIHRSSPLQIKHLGVMSRPDYSCFDMDFYIGYLLETGQSWEIMASRGCVGNCAFCYKMVGHGIHLRSPAAVLDEMEWIMTHYNLPRFYFVDDNLFGTSPWFYDFLAQKAERGLKCTFVVQARMADINEKILQAGYDNGLICISSGIESVSQHTLDLVRKHTTLQEIEEKIALVHSTPVALSVNFIIGFPWETEADYLELTHFIQRNDLTHRANMHFLTPLPKTTIYAEAKRNGLIRDEWEYIKNVPDLYWQLYVNLTQMPDEVLQHWFDKLLELCHRKIAFPVSERYLSKLAGHYYKRVPENKRVTWVSTGVTGNMP
ncbi:MAG: B12-binding domain-containing radical SAM protein [Pirellulaceae bacterium]